MVISVFIISPFPPPLPPTGRTFALALRNGVFLLPLSPYLPVVAPPELEGKRYLGRTSLPPSTFPFSTKRILLPSFPPFGSTPIRLNSESSSSPNCISFFSPSKHTPVFPRRKKNFHFFSFLRRARNPCAKEAQDLSSSSPSSFCHPPTCLSASVVSTSCGTPIYFHFLKSFTPSGVGSFKLEALSSQEVSSSP